MHAGVVGPLTPFGIWSLKWQRPFWNATIKTAADLRSMATAGLASHLTLICLHLGGLQLGVKSTSCLTSAKSKGRRTPTHNQMLCFHFLLFMAHTLLFVLCCAAVVATFPHNPSASSSFYVSSMHDKDAFFFFPAGGATWTVGCCALVAGQDSCRTHPACLDL